MWFLMLQSKLASCAILTICNILIGVLHHYNITKQLFFNHLHVHTEEARNTSSA
jgi:hypothetical protein